jgi:uncharacterized protein YxjI
MFEYEGQRVDNNDYLMKKMKGSLQQKDAEIAALRSRLEETIRVKDGKIEALEKSVTFFKKRYHNQLKPRDKPKSETTDDESQGVSETMGEDSESPPIST